jgi:hypothetical protein
MRNGTVDNQAEFGQDLTVENFPQSGPSRQVSTTIQCYLSVLSSHMRTDNLSTPIMNQAVTANRHVLRISIVRTRWVR